MTYAESRTAPAPGVLEITRGRRTLGVVLVDGDGCHWQRTSDVDRLATVAIVSGAAVAGIGLVAAAARRGPVQRITMGPGGWVSFRGTGSAPRLRGGRRPWWAVVLRARPLDH